MPLAAHALVLPPRLQAVPLSEASERHRLQVALWSIPKLEQHSTGSHPFERAGGMFFSEC